MRLAVPRLQLMHVASAPTSRLSTPFCCYVGKVLEVSNAPDRGGQTSFPFGLLRRRSSAPCLFAILLQSPLIYKSLLLTEMSRACSVHLFLFSSLIFLSSPIVQRHFCSRASFTIMGWIGRINDGVANSRVGHWFQLEGSGHVSQRHQRSIAKRIALT